MNIRNPWDFEIRVEAIRVQWCEIAFDIEHHFKAEFLKEHPNKVREDVEKNAEPTVDHAGAPSLGQE